MKKEEVPRHVAIVPDGNRRWARNKGFEVFRGHEKAIEFDNIKALLEESRNLGIECVTIWGFSTENWKRSNTEKKILFRLFNELLDNLEGYLLEEKIRINHAGRKDRLPPEIIRKMEKLEEKTKDFKSFTVQICLDYGGRDDIVRVVNRLVAEGKEVDEESFNKMLDTKDLPNPDLIIRTGGDYRVSNFMLFQLAYSEFYFTKTFFPDFGPKELRAAVEEYSSRKRRYGGD